MNNIKTGDRVRVIQDCRCQGREGLVGWTDGSIFEVKISGMNTIGLNKEGIELIEKTEEVENKEECKMEKKIVSLQEVELSVVKTVGVIEFLNMEIELEERCLNSHKGKVEEFKKLGDERLKAAHEACIRDIRETVKRLRSRREVQEEYLLKMWQLEYKGGNLYRYDDNDHEQWLMEQVDPSLNGGVL